MPILYGLKSCDSCREARKWLDEQGVDYDYHDVRDDGLDAALLQRWCGRLGWEALVNRRSLTWRKVPETDRHDMNEKLAIATLLDYPTLLKRPVLEGDDYIEVGFDEQAYQKRLR